MTPSVTVDLAPMHVPVFEGCGDLAARFAKLGNIMELSGMWGHDDLPFLDLKFDGARRVSGTTYWRAEVRSVQAAITAGSFDPTAHALRLEDDAPSLDGKGKSHYVIDGTLDNGTLGGTYDCAGLNGNFHFHQDRRRQGLNHASFVASPTGSRVSYQPVFPSDLTI